MENNENNNKNFIKDNKYIIVLGVIVIIAIVVIVLLSGVNKNQPETPVPPVPPGPPGTGDVQNPVGEVDFLQVAGMQVPVAISYVNQSKGGYTYCSNSNINDVITENGVTYRASVSFKSLNDLKAHLKRIMTDEMINKHFNNSGYIERDGKLYCSYVSKQDSSTVFFNESAIETVKNPEFVISNETQSSFDATFTFNYDTNQKMKYVFSFKSEGTGWLINNYSDNN